MKNVEESLIALPAKSRRYFQGSKLFLAIDLLQRESGTALFEGTRAITDG